MRMPQTPSAVFTLMTCREPVSFEQTRRMVRFLATVGHTVNRKQVQRLMRQMGLVGMAPGPNTSQAHPEHKVYPYLLRGVAVVGPNQVPQEAVRNAAHPSCW